MSRDETAGCLGKINYPTRAAAATVHKHLIAKKSFQGRLNIYHCGRCSNFHLGHEPSMPISDRKSRENVSKARRYYELVKR